jgi:DNA replication and repair protein RecF
MYLQTLTLHNYRAYEHLRLELGQGLQIFTGPNAAGKTTLCEAIYLLAATRSPRAGNDRELVRFGASAGRVAGELVGHEGRVVELAVNLGGEGGKRLEVNGRAVGSVREMVGQASVVMFTPDDLALIKGGPPERRRFLNTAIGPLQPAYFDDLLRYRRALRQRNEVLRALREGSSRLGQLDPWTEQLVAAGAGVACGRQRFISALHDEASRLHELLASGHETLQLTYQGELSEATNRDEAAEIFRQQLARVADREWQRGTTLAGPHRDELQVTVNATPVRQFGSQGQQRTAALSLKLGQAQVARQWTTEPPLLLLDDCLSELDSRRSQAVLDLGARLDSLIVTSARPDEALLSRREGHFYQVSGGEVKAWLPA